MRAHVGEREGVAAGAAARRRKEGPEGRHDGSMAHYSPMYFGAETEAERGDK